MNVRLACAWVREQMISRAHHRLVVGPERAAEEDAVYDAAVAEVDGLLDPSGDDSEPVDLWSDPEWVAAMGGEMAPAGRG